LLLGLPLEDYGFLPELPHLRRLNISYPGNVADIPFSRLNSVEYLWIQGVSTDFHGLREMPKLKELVIANIRMKRFMSINLPSSIERFSVLGTKVDVSGMCPERLRYVHFGRDTEVRGAGDLLSSPRVQFVGWTEIPDVIKDRLVARGVSVHDG
jgi:hypothetical protein